MIQPSKSGATPSEPPPKNRFELGQVLRERYEVVRFIGRGGMGEVYEARDTRDDRPVAVKTVLTKFLNSGKVVARFRREIDLSRRISHPNVLQIFDVFELLTPVEDSDEPASSPCMVMELLAGETLADRLETEKRIPTDEARPLVCQMARALAAAHRAEVIHRDLKPDNVFLVPRDDGSIRVVLTDFGVARPNKPEQEDTFTATDVIVGTPTYMAPEQLELEEALPASDIYTLGLVMFEMVTGSFPFQGETAIQVVFMRVQQDAPSPRTVIPDLDPVWEEVIMRCLERDPARRLADAEQIAVMLESGETSGPALEAGKKWWWPFV